MNRIDVVIPVYNEERVLADSVAKLRDFLGTNLTCRWQIVIADNGSVDGTLAVARSLSEQYLDVTYVTLELKGRGRALRKAWLESEADAVSYMDVDLSTELTAFPKLIEALDEGYQVVVGSRLMAGSKVKRSLKREITSRGYNLLIKLLFWSGFSDAQCGFKALKRDVAQELIPHIKDQAWFFDTELLLLAERKGYRIKDVPVEWVEDEDTRVKIVNTAWEDIKGLLRVRFKPPF
ncbi:MAG: glycosyltransferase family 2 protein [Dehalococcoidia bacterium]|nr:MAG: glycosyltransferase family 2 protein [Dehalococcoidia bacterium]UCG82792.1 MAG: glycosyltransferase family 2 protein [Dehalococcoidia bacterium]